MKVLALFVMSSAWAMVEVDLENFDTHAAGKQAMLHFVGEPCRHCQMVDCAGAGEGMCQKLEVYRFPTMMYGDVFGLEEYKGARDLPSLTRFIREEMTPPCGPKNLNPCEPSERALIAKFQGMARTNLDHLHADADREYKAIEEEAAQVRRSFAKRWDAFKKQKDEDEDAVFRKHRMLQWIFNDQWEEVEEEVFENDYSA